MVKCLKIVLTGAESTGKSTLCQRLSEFYNTNWLPEFAREYVENLGRNYTFDDVIFIAKKQIELENEYLKDANKLLFVDTSFVVLKVWFEVVYNKVPEWLLEQMEAQKPDFYLICNNDLAWIADGVRENGGEMRNLLFEKYKKEVELLKVPYKIISGIGEQRKNLAIESVENFIKNS